MTTTTRKHSRLPLLLCSAILTGMPLALTACDKETSKEKTTTTKTTETPDGTKKTTETHEKKVETEKKDPH